jgi:DNA modification methylase
MPNLKVRRRTGRAQDKHSRSLYSTRRGSLYLGRVEDRLQTKPFERLHGSVDLIFTSPPFPLIRKKAYGNEDGRAYVEWLASLAPLLTELLSPTGSIVIEVGNSWVAGSPVMSTLSLEALLAFKKSADLHLCQQFICHNPARLPGPAQWVTIEKIRLKDSWTHVWWFAKTARPKADNSRVLLPYSIHMKRLLKQRKYNSGKRPSGHVVSTGGFLRDRGGAISPSVIDVTDPDTNFPGSLLRFAGTAVDKSYQAYCERNGYDIHPARMQSQLAAFFVQFLTDPKDLVFDPFAGSNTTGFVAEELGRRWIATEANEGYALGSKGRFLKTSPRRN